jgi:hypothetical protein
VAARLEGGLPDCLPILGYGLRTLPLFPMVLHRGGFPDGS